MRGPVAVKAGRMALPMPPVKCEITVKLTFSSFVDYPVLDVVLVDVMHEDIADVGGVQFAGDHRALVKLRTAAVFQAFVRRYDRHNPTEAW